ncbi:MAG: hypothetical protein EPO09_21480 [Aquabacterium sp.]|uniref:lipoprotein n=1 Tax=Aquabacterium sp. TaxID=1872578 RepID=UPI001215C6D6|nr:lipoprotein [Aquabacterium sp.]TAK82819.1 MAG: hypothetical protein EPO09_21480 [Aquabacterium sp.]
MKKFVSLLGILLIVTGCATAPDSLEPTSLKRATSTEVLHVKAISLRDDQIALAPGDYKAELEDSNGTFYRGPGNCFRILRDTYQGGIYVTNSTGTKKYRLYYYKTANAVPMDTTQTQSIVESTAPKAPIVSGAVGGAIGAGIVDYMKTMNDGKLMLLQPIDGINYAELVKK